MPTKEGLTGERLTVSGERMSGERMSWKVNIQNIQRTLSIPRTPVTAQQDACLK
jgi:hypothetical protein